MQVPVSGTGAIAANVLLRQDLRSEGLNTKMLILTENRLNGLLLEIQIMSGNEFEKAGEDKPLSLVQEFLLFITQNKKWWLIPILLVLSMVGLLAALAPTGAAPFIYSLF